LGIRMRSRTCGGAASLIPPKNEFPHVENPGK
jgi:hypothetical protein